MQIMNAFSLRGMPEKDARMATGDKNVVRSSSGRLMPSTPRT
jgi:hypothetical protein